MVDIEELTSKLKSQFGPPCFGGEKNQNNVLNQHFFAGLYQALKQPVYAVEDEMFFQYNNENGLWEPQSQEAMLNNVSLMMMWYAGKTQVFSINRKRDTATIRQIISFLKALSRCENAFERRGQAFIHCGNGVIEFQKRDDGCLIPVLKDFSPQYMSRNRTEYEFHKDAVCPGFLEKLLEPSISKDDIWHLQLYVGQCLLGVNDSQTFLLLTGTAGGGKSTLVNIIEKLIKRKNCTELRLEHMNGRFETQRLLGKTLLTAKDVPSSFLNTKGAHMLKALTGKDTVTIEHKGSNAACDVCCAFNAIITSNNTLHVSVDGDADAWRRRIIWIKYTNEPPKEKIPNFDDVLLAEEGNGILRWAVEGAMLLLENDGKIIKSDQQKAKVDSLLNESNALDNFICSNIRRSAGEDITTAEILESFRLYCSNHGWSTPSQRYIENHIPELMFQNFGASKRTDIERNGKNNRGYKNFELISM